MQDRYACFQETQEPAVYFNRSGKPTNTAVPPCGAFNTCLAARGYYRSDTTNRADFNQAGSLIVPRGTEIACWEYKNKQFEELTDAPADYQRKQ